jgi:ATP-dependent Clp protease ATP-binding subunit ClpA
MAKPYISEEIALDPEMRSSEVVDFERRMLNKIVGQGRAVRRVVNMYQIYLAGMAMPGRPIGNLLFLGPTGSGKTRVVEASAEILFGNPRAFIKIDCAEFQHSHEIAKLIGSPPGYLGHRETPPLLTQEAIDQHQTERVKMTFILFDEIEKANDALWQLLLGILDKGTLTLGDNRKVDMSRCVIFMTSNLGAVEMAEMMQGGIGFTSGTKYDDAALAALDSKLYRTALEVAKRKFSPEFMNRIDKVVVFRTLTETNLRQVLDIELNAVQDRVMASQKDKQFIFRCTEESKDFLLREGTDLKYGARHLKRAIERHLVFPLSNLIATGQIGQGDVIKIDLSASRDKLTFARERAIPGLAVESPNVLDFSNRKTNQVGARIPAPEVHHAAVVDRTRKR